jgi:hypothetical protein
MSWSESTLGRRPEEGRNVRRARGWLGAGVLATASLAAGLVPSGAGAHLGGGHLVVGAGVGLDPPSQIVVVAASSSQPGGIVYYHSAGPDSPGFIALDCVEISDVGATRHDMGASGQGDDGKRYYFGVEDYGASSVGDFAAIVTTENPDGPCGAPSPVPLQFLGQFATFE